MSNDNLQDKLQRAYHSMLENVEDFIEKEGKDIREAFYKAEDKLGEWEQLSKDEVKKVSDEVKRDLTSLSDTLVGAKAAFREQIEFDKRYLAEATWNKLMSIADKSTVQLIQLKTSLEENVREITQEEHAGKHHEHQRWDSEHAMWLGEIVSWENSYAEAKAKLETVKNMLDQQVVALEEHKQVILSHDATEKAHEHTMTEAERDPSNLRVHKEDKEADVRHKQEIKTHEQQAIFHEKMKAHHHQTMALINTLHKESQV
jgi:hypothetical protein